MHVNKSILGIGLIAMSIGMVGCGNDANSQTSQAPQNGKNMGSQVRMNMKDTTNGMFTDGKYNATNRGRVLSSDRGGFLTTDNTSKNTTGMGYGTSKNTTGMGYATNRNTNNMGYGTDNTKAGTQVGTQTNMMRGSENGNAYDLARMEKIQQVLGKMQQYNDVTCIVNGNTAIVGCTPTNNANKTQTKNEITDIVKRCDSSIQNCEVITNQDGVSKVSKMAENIRKGNIGTTISQDFQKMLNDIVS